MKLKDIKHDHSLTDLLKVFLYSIIMLLPFFSVLTRTLYVTCNKNAFESYSDTSQVQLLNADNTNTLSGNTLYISYNTQEGLYNYSQQYLFTWCSVDFGDYTAAALEYLPNGIRTYSNGTIQLHNPNNNTWAAYAGPNGDRIWGNTLNNFTIVLKDTISNQFEGGHMRVQVLYETQGKLDNAFTYSMNELKNNDLFNWSINTGTYSGINAMTNGLGITNDVIPMILTYWFMITVIYIIIDIVIKSFTFLTHFIGSKTAA